VRAEGDPGLGSWAASFRRDYQFDPEERGRHDCPCYFQQREEVTFEKGSVEAVALRGLGGEKKKKKNAPGGEVANPTKGSSKLAREALISDD